MVLGAFLFLKGDTMLFQGRNLDSETLRQICQTSDTFSQFVRNVTQTWPDLNWSPRQLIALQDECTERIPNFPSKPT